MNLVAYICTGLVLLCFIGLSLCTFFIEKINHDLFYTNKTFPYGKIEDRIVIVNNLQKLSRILFLLIVVLGIIVFILLA